jgi:rhodanese-related sulfurtransferase
MGASHVHVRGIWELPPAILEEHLNHVQVVDVRERDEYEGPLGHIKGSRLIPLSEMPSRASELARDTPGGRGVPLGRALCARPS